MRHPSKRVITGVAMATFTALTVLSASAEEPVAEGTLAMASTETLFIAAGCPQDTPGTCTSTRWLGKQPGDATSNFLTSTTPVDEVLYQAEGSVNWRDYASDKSLRTGGYPLRTDEPVTMAVTVTANALAVNSTVHGRLSGRVLDSAGKAKNVTFGEAEQVITLVADQETVTFTFDVPAELEGLVLTNMLAEVAVHGVNAQGGYIDQEGGSTVEIPYWESTPA